MTEVEVIPRAMGENEDDVRSASELDESAPKSGTCISDDLSTMTVVDNCSASETDPDHATNVELPIYSTPDNDDIDDKRISTFAEIQMSVMSDGTIGIGGEVSDYMRDSNDDWIAQ
ncbi:hypothetical protein EB835_18310 [Brevibacterium sp. S22]|uniref:hypothetical protein n=1 Tax=Brevibacterium sp. S22 TaxID=2483794 RepID=UPI0010929DF0|nr:hypothetical protein [Brevibacterium sp. S22]TGD27772.1 hypothetical protein EB835_18310 [Brevibacterium sp. S22]